jgi:calcium-dependent protein kinase
LGTGAFGTVLKGRVKGTGESGWRAVKKIPKRKVKDHNEFLNEIEILQKMDHPNIIKLYETFEDSRNIYMVTEYSTFNEDFAREANYSTRSSRRVSSLRRRLARSSSK